jgi:hypothetical protein
MQALVMRTVVPILGRERSENRVFDRENKATTLYEAMMHLATHEVEALHIVKRQRAYDNLE